MKTNISSIFVATLVAASLQACAQSAAPVQSISDSAVQVVADAAGLAPMSATDLPRTGTFWVMMPGANGNLTALPYPALPASLSALPIYSVVATFLWWMTPAANSRLRPPDG